MNISASSLAIAGFVIAGLLGTIWIQSTMLNGAHERIELTRQELDVERARSAGLQRSIAELERNAAAKAVRETTASTAKEAIAAASEGDDSAIAPVLLQGLQAADQIGELE